MARPKQSTAVMEARNAFKAHPERRPGPEPEHEGPLGAVPPHFTPSEAAAWMQICEDSAPGVLTQSERILVEILAKLLADIRDNPEEATTAKYTRIESLIGKIGCTPADRNRVVVPKAKDASDFDGM
jgi:hypothetical protein